MRSVQSTGFKRDYKDLDRATQHQVDKTIKNLEGDPKRPGLHAERLKSSKEDYSCRVTRGIRIIYRMRDSQTIELLQVGQHDVVYRKYFLTALAAGEEIPASELEAFQMFTPKGTQDDLKGIEDLVRDAQVSGEPQNIADLLRSLISSTLGEGTAGKAKVPGLQDVGGPINIIPAADQGTCRQVLLAFCFDGDKFGDRLREIAYQAGIHCPKTKLVVLVKSQWNPTEWKKNHEKAFDKFEADVVIFLAAFGRLVRVAVIRRKAR
jgi:mRNA-degrading endonuclease YafQ of YafQ-DinJ toxin-antitoxin module